MKTSGVLILNIALTVLLGASVVKADPSDVEMDAPAVNVEESPSEDLVIHMAPTLKTPAIDYRVLAPSMTSEASALYRSLPADQKEKFKLHRSMLLTSLARVFTPVRMGFGVAGLTTDRVIYHSVQMAQDPMVQAFAGSVLNGGSTFMNGQRSFDTDLLAAMLASSSPYVRAKARILKRDERATRIVMKARGYEMIAKTLQAIDRALWKRAAVFATANEGGAMGAVSLVALAGLKDKELKIAGKTFKVRLGGLFDLGFSLGYNFDRKAVVIQLYRNVERFQKSELPLIATTAVAFKAGGYIAVQPPKRANYRFSGTSYYPPVGSFFTSTSDRIEMFGIDTAPISIPTYPFGELITYSNALDLNVMLRLQVSLTPVLSMLNWAADRNPQLYFARFTVQNALAQMKQKFGSGPGSCQAIFQ